MSDVSDPQHVDDPRLSELEAQVLAKFEADKGEPEGYAAMVGAADEPIPASGEPDVASPEPHPGDPSPPSDEPPAPPPAAPEQAPPEAQAATAPDLTGVDAAERTPTAITWDSWDDDTRDQAVRITEWASGLNEESMLQIDAVLSGQYTLVPVEDVPKITAFYEAQQNPAANAASTANTPAPAAPSPQTSDNPYAYAEELPEDPRVTQLQSQVAELTQAQTQTQEQQYLAQARDAINSGTQAWFEYHHDLTPAERSRLETWVARSGVYPGFASSYSPDRAVQMSLDAALSQDTEIQTRHADALVAQRLQEEREAAVANQSKARAQSAISGSGASAAQVPQTLDPDAAMVAMVEQAMYGQT